MDRLNEEEIAAAEAALRGNSINKEGEEEEGGEEGGAGMSSTTTRIVQAVQELILTDDSAGGGDFVDNEEIEHTDDREWETAMKSRNAARRQKRVAEHQEESNEEEEEEEEEESDEDDDDDDDQAVEEVKNTSITSNGSTSTICSITSDFAMQNVTLQMGLRLVTLDGRLISQLSRWVLRCTACSSLTREMGRVFCPRCGNAALDKVRVTIAPDGTEQYGVKKKHILRGTKFSLPKPKGGRSKDVILREDVLMEKARRLRRKHVRKGMDELDAFAPEMMHNDAWFQTAALPGGDKGAAALLAGWKKNPNERKHIATNRRRK
jgi:RNA-binding protein NOB1